MKLTEPSLNIWKQSTKPFIKKISGFCQLRIQLWHVTNLFKNKYYVYSVSPATAISGMQTNHKYLSTNVHPHNNYFVVQCVAMHFPTPVNKFNF